MKKSKLLLVLSALFIIANLFAQTPYEVSVRFINTTTGLDYTDVSTIQFEVELDPPSGDIQVGPSALCTVNIADIGAGVSHSFVQFDLANFANSYTPTSDVRVTIWDGSNLDGAGETIYNVTLDLDPSTGYMGWNDWLGVGGYPLDVEPDIPPVTLSNFSVAVFANEFVQISWTTESELNNLGWNIYRGLSDDPELVTQLNYELICGAGSTTEPTDYSFMDENVDNNTTYWYWLESVSVNGETQIYGPVTITVQIDGPTPELPTETRLLGIYPNPFN